MTLFIALNEIRNTQDPSLHFDFVCRAGICGSCAMLIDGRPNLACRTLTRDLGSTITLAPLPFFELIGDLSVNTGKWMRGTSERLQTWIHDNAPADLDVKFFLPDAPPPRDAWLRRQVHETTIHAVDAMAARLGRAPRADEVWVKPWLAADGVDEVLTGFVVRRNPQTSLPRTQTVLFKATDVDRSWLVRFTHDGAVTTRDTPDEPADVTVTGTARELYLSVWNRGREAEASDPTWWDDWAEHVKVTWA